MKLINKIFKKENLLPLFLGLIAIIIAFIFINNMDLKKEENFTVLYSNVDEIMHQPSKATNTSIENYLFYKPKGYKFIKDSFVMVNGDKYIELIPELIDVNSSAYTINEGKKVIYKTDNTIENSQDSIQMIVWNVGTEAQKVYEVLIVDEKGRGVSGDFIEEDLEQGILDMSYILNSVTIKEQ